MLLQGQQDVARNAMRRKDGARARNERPSSSAVTGQIQAQEETRTQKQSG
jgi:hypothetical protein